VDAPHLLQCVAVHYSVLQFVTVCCSVSDSVRVRVARASELASPVVIMGGQGFSSLFFSFLSCFYLTLAHVTDNSHHS